LVLRGCKKTHKITYLRTPAGFWNECARNDSACEVGEKVRNVIKDRNLKSLNKRKTDSFHNRMKMSTHQRCAKDLRYQNEAAIFQLGATRSPMSKVTGVMFIMCRLTLCLCMSMKSRHVTCAEVVIKQTAYIPTETTCKVLGRVPCKAR